MNQAHAQAPAMRALVVEDSPTQAILLRQRLLRAGFEVGMAANGREALVMLDREAPTLILADMDMPELSGLKLVREVRRRQIPAPVVLMTALGNEDVAVEALRAGAAAYIPKQKLDQELGRVMEQVLVLCRLSQGRQQLAGSIVGTACRYDLPSDSSLSGPLVRRLQQDLVRLHLGEPALLRQIGMAIHEALLNAIEHGNLEVPSALKEDGDRFRQMVNERRAQAMYGARRVRVKATYLLAADHAELQYVIADEGPGFKWAELPDPTDPANLELPSGRGLLLIHTFMDEVRFNATGNEITMTKRLTSD